MTPTWLVAAHSNQAVLFSIVPWRVPGSVSHKAGLIVAEYGEGWEW
ncbi:MAG: hypothetical protein ACOYB3_01840 [Azonexus sp.]